MPIRVLPEPAVGVVAKGTQTNVSDNTITTVATMTANGARNVTRIKFSGEGYARWTLVVDAVTEETVTNGQYSGEFNFGDEGLYVAPGSVLDIKVEHFYGSETLDFNATIYGF